MVSVASTRHPSCRLRINLSSSQYPTSPGRPPKTAPNPSPLSKQHLLKSYKEYLVKRRASTGIERRLRFAQTLILVAILAPLMNRTSAHTPYECLIKMLWFVPLLYFLYDVKVKDFKQLEYLLV
ncbi:hypothetical protein IAQ61_011063 [Plenodomus lingam]|uniref:uncharacterized protein n=1 Tax=Leptosphaeria maculans TaxID=5022 RepID=UPI00332594F3|nr:hypothetical protein IAQ61_011063 [Plenodomus lingam]